MAFTYGFDLGTAGDYYSSAQFSEMSDYISKDCVSSYEDSFDLVLNNGFNVTVKPGLAYVAGRYLKSTENATFTLYAPYSSATRYDAIAIVVDIANRIVSMKLLSDIDPDSPTQTDTEYQMYLYTFEIPYGITMLSSSNVTDCRKQGASLQEASPGAMAAYILSIYGAGEQVRAAAANVASAVNTAEDAIANYSAAIESTKNTKVGDLREAANSPGSEWMLCNGATISSSYTELISLLGGSTLPDVSSIDERLSMWIYAGSTS